MFSKEDVVKNLFHHFVLDSKVKIVFEKKEALALSEPVINLSIHPIRFCEDIFLNFETNKPYLLERLRQFEVNYTVFYHYADLIKAKTLNNTSRIKLPENSLLIVGQLPEDKAVFDGEKHLSLFDFEVELSRLAKQHSAIYFKPHPYCKSTQSHFKQLKKRFDNINIITENIYTLLSHPNIETVSGITSSTLHEAIYFRKKIKFLGKPQFQFSEKDIGIKGDYFQSNFWSILLDIPDQKIALPTYENMLRRTFGDYWGYTALGIEIDAKNLILSKFKKLAKLRRAITYFCRSNQEK